MKSPRWFLHLAVLTLCSHAHATAPFDGVSLQGYLKSTGGAPVNGTFNGRITLYQNGAPCWSTGASLVPIAFSDGAFAKTLTGGVSSGLCAGALGSSQFRAGGPYTWTLAVDIDGDNVTETSFTNIPITAVPLAMVAEAVTGPVSVTQLNGVIDPSNLPALGESNTASNLGSGAQIFKQKSGVDLQMRSLTAASSKVAVAQNAADVSFDVVESNLSLANFGGTLSAAKITGVLATGNLGSGTASASTYLRGDGAWQALPALGEVNTASNVGSGAQIFKQKSGVDLQMRTLTAASAKVALTQNASDVSIDVVDAGLALDGSQIATGTVGAGVLPVAGAAAAGIVSTGVQTIAGAKTLSGALTLSSALALTKADVATVATITCLASATAVVRLTGTTATSLQGINPGSDGQILIVYTDGNIGTGLTVAHNNAGGCANGKIFTNTAANIVSTTAASTAAFVFIYNLASLRWHLVSALQ